MSQYDVFRPTFLREKFILTLQNLSITFLTELGACKLYMLLHKKATILIVW